MYAFVGISVVVGFMILIGWVSLRYFLHRIFYHAPVKNEQEPGDFGLNVVEYYLDTVNNKKIQTYFIEGKDSKPVIIGIHGWENTVEKMLPLAEFLSQKRYTLLLVNVRNHGRSDNDSYSTMVKYSEDLNAAVNFVIKKYGPEKPLILIGHSLGGATCLYKTAHDKRIRGVISVASFSNLERMIKQSILSHNFPSWIMPPLIRYVERGVGEQLSNLSPVTNTEKIDVPLLLLHGTDDKIIPLADFEELKSAANPDLLHWKLMAGGDHSSLLRDEEIFLTIENFLCLFE
jgi:alpha-beta hydrolase superfamily lysophospholipase